jgi:hypothetical protein
MRFERANIDSPCLVAHGECNIGTKLRQLS